MASPSDKSPPRAPAAGEADDAQTSPPGEDAPERGLNLGDGLFTADAGTVRRLIFAELELDPNADTTLIEPEDPEAPPLVISEVEPAPRPSQGAESLSAPDTLLDLQSLMQRKKEGS